jgi:hypothetical protein
VTGKGPAVCVRLSAQQVRQVVRDAQGEGSLAVLLSGKLTRDAIPPVSVWEQRVREGSSRLRFSTTLVKGLLILIYIGSGEPVSLGDIATELGIGVSTIHRYAQTLELVGLVEKDLDTSRYMLAR